MIGSPHLKKRRRLAPIEWQHVFDTLCRTYHPDKFHIDEVARLAKDRSITISPESLRVKLARYQTKGYLKKMGMKHYQITPKGIMFFNLLKSTLDE